MWSITQDFYKLKLSLKSINILNPIQVIVFSLPWDLNNNSRRYKESFIYYSAFIRSILKSYRSLINHKLNEWRKGFFLNLFINAYRLYFIILFIYHKYILALWSFHYLNLLKPQTFFKFPFMIIFIYALTSSSVISN